MAETDEPPGSAPDAEPEHPDEREVQDHERSFRRLGDSLISSLIGDSSAAFKRGQRLATGVAQGTKDELVRMISHEVRGFLDKMDAADLIQEIVSGLVIEMKTEIRFRRDENGRIEPDIRTTETRVESEADLSGEAAEDKRPAEGKRRERAPTPAEGKRRPMGKVVKDLKDKVKVKPEAGKQTAGQLSSASPTGSDPESD